MEIFNNRQPLLPAIGFHAKSKAGARHLKNIPNVPCACCGNRVIVSEALMRAYRSITKPLEYIMQLGTLDVWQQKPAVWEVLQSFAKKYPKYSLDKILENEKNYNYLKNKVTETVYNPDKDINRTSGILFKDILTRSRERLKGSGTVMKRLAVFKKYLEGTKLETFEQLQIYAQKYPRKTLSEIINMEEIYKFHKTKDILQRAQGREKMNYHFNNILSMVKKCSPESEEYFKNIENEVEQIFSTKKDPQYRKYKIKQLYQRALKQIKCEHLQTKVFKELEQIPETLITTDSFLSYAKTHNYSDIRIIYSLLNPYEGSFEHIVPDSRGGSGKVENGLIMHRRCNDWRGSTPYQDFMQYHPQMPKNIQKQINYIGDYILHNDTTPFMKLWPINISTLIYNYSNGAISPNAKKYCKKMLEQIKSSKEERKSSITNLKEKRSGKLKQRKTLLEEVDKLNKDLKDINKDVSDLNEKNNIDTDAANTLKKYLQEET